MRSPSSTFLRMALFATALAACGGGGGGDGDDTSGGDDGSGSGSNEPTPLPRCATPVSGSNVTLRKITEVDGSALIVTAPREDARLFVAQQNGRVRIVDTTGTLLPAPFLDLTEGFELTAGGESGLLGLAFHPQYHVNGSYFVFYTTSNANIVARCQVDPTNANRSLTCGTILSIPDFAGNHNGGMIEFGKDGYLYIGTGDGGGGGDPNRNGQSLVDGSPSPNSVALLGKILRIDVDREEAGKKYAIPSDNPFASGGGAPEIYMLGLRNPWRWSFDRETGDIWIGDVGQDQLEEMNAVLRAQQAGKNFGWSMYEGTDCYRQPCAAGTMVFPFDEHRHSEGWASVVAGDTYRGTCYPDIVGWHYYTDHYAATFHRARLAADGSVTKEDVPGTFPGSIASMHSDARGEIYATTTGGDIYHLEVAQ